MIPLELVDLVARWIHVIAGIMWIGNSLLFNWIDRSLERPDRDGITPQPVGTIWLLHSGGFYYVEKTLLAGMQGPSPRILHCSSGRRTPPGCPGLHCSCWCTGPARVRCSAIHRLRCCRREWTCV